MNAPPTVARSIVVAALDSLGIEDQPFARVLAVTFSVDTISIDRANGERTISRIVDECASCHAPKGRPHTEYCQAPPFGAEITGVPGLALPPLPDSAYPADAVALVVELDSDDAEPRRCRYPNADYGDGRGCQREDCPLHGNPNEDGPDPVALVDDLEQDQVDAIAAEPAPWVDNGCRCPNPDQHRPGCPAAAPITTCRVCGCTDDEACEGGCSWVADDLCSACQSSTSCNLVSCPCTCDTPTNHALRGPDHKPGCPQRWTGSDDDRAAREHHRS